MRLYSRGLMEQALHKYIQYLENNNIPLISNKRGVGKYYNIPLCLDTENTTFQDDVLNVTKYDRHALNYILMIGVGRDDVFYTRDIREITQIFKDIEEILQLSYDQKIKCLVHNLPYDLSFIKPYIEIQYNSPEEEKLITRSKELFKSKKDSGEITKKQYDNLIKKLPKRYKILGYDAHNIFNCTTSNHIELQCSYVMTHLKLEDLELEDSSVYKLSPKNLLNTDNVNALKLKYLLANSKQLPDDLLQELKQGYNYSYLRDKDTILTEAELLYCENDILVLLEYMFEKIFKVQSGICNPDNLLSYQSHVIGVRDNPVYYCNLPYTLTSIPRKDIKNVMNEDQKYVKDVAKNLICEPTLLLDMVGHKYNVNGELLSEHEQGVRYYKGGFTHANVMNVGQTFKNVGSYDFTSSYPCVLVSEKYPMSPFRKVPEKQYMKYLSSNEPDKSYCWCVEIQIENIRPRLLATDYYISTSQCHINDSYAKFVKECIKDNGRLVSYSGTITLKIVDIDWYIIKKNYQFKNFKVVKMFRSMSAYLPANMRLRILSYYVDKTQLKGVEGAEELYKIGKTNLNSCYGVFAENPIKDKISYNKDLREFTASSEVQSLFEEIQGMNEYNRCQKAHKGRINSYMWAVWCTAYARNNLWTAIFTMKRDYIYADTDSVKVIGYKYYKDYFDKYNTDIQAKLEKSIDDIFERKVKAKDQEFLLNCGLEKTNLYKLIRPESKDGIEKPLGVWDFEGEYSHFKVLHAKCYAGIKKGKLECTIAGIDKSFARDYLLHLSKGDPIKALEYFTDGLKFPKSFIDCEGKYHESKKMHSETQETKQIEFTDYTGKKSIVTVTKGSICLYPVEFTIGDLTFEYNKLKELTNWYLEQRKNITH